MIRLSQGRRTAAMLAAVLVALSVYNLFLSWMLADASRQWRTLEARAAAGSDEEAVLAGLAHLPQAALERAPQMVEFISNASARLVQNGRAGEAEAILRHAVVLAPNSGSARYAYAVFLRQMEHYDAALRELRSARALLPNDARIPLQLGLVYFDLNRRREAEAAFRQAVALDPALSDAYLGLAYVNNSSRRHHQAIPYVRRFNELRPAASEGRNMLARLYLDLRQFEPAAREAREAVRLRPTDSASWHLLGLAQAGGVAATSAQSEQAVESFKRAIALDPIFPISHYELGRLYLQKGQLGEAVAELRQAAELWPGNGQYHWTLMQALRRTGDHEGAAREARLAKYHTQYTREQKRLWQRIHDDPKALGHYEELARLHLAYEEPERAAHVLRNALAANPQAPRIRGLLSQLERGGGVSMPGGAAGGLGTGMGTSPSVPRSGGGAGL